MGRISGISDIFRRKDGVRMAVRSGEERDIAAIVGIYDRILAKEEQSGSFTGWKRGVYPTGEDVRSMLADGELYVMEENGTVVAAARINHTPVPEYAQVRWAFREEDPNKVLIIHTLVVDPACAGKGYGSAFIRFYEDMGRALGCTCLRMDTNITNRPARRLYAHLGYREADVVSCVFNGLRGIQLVCLEKALPPEKREEGVYLRSIVEQDPAPIVVCDLQHTIVYMNPAAVRRYAKHGGAALVGKSLLDCHNAVSNEKIRQAAVWFAASPEHNRRFTYHNPKENRDTYMVALRDGEGRLAGYYEKHEYRTPERGEKKGL